MRWTLATVALFALCCGAREAERSRPAAEVSRSPEPRGAAGEPSPEAEPTVAEAEPPPEAEPVVIEAEPVVIEAGARLGPVRIGMSEDEVRQLGLDERAVDPRSRAFGPYRVYLRGGEVVRVEAQIGALERVRFGETVIEAGTDIHAIRDIFGDCVWTEGGGERYRCAGGTLTVRTTNSMDPRRYTLGVQGG